MRRTSRLFALVFSLVLAMPTLASPIAQLDRVGGATLRVLFWTIYDSKLYTPSGRYQGIEPQLALEVDYHRNVSAARLLEQTRAEWQKQGIYQPEHERWLDSLAAIWPDLRRGDVMVVRVDEQLASTFYLNGRLIGRLTDPVFTNNFLAIWLSENSSYPQLRKQLIGQSS